MNSYTALVTTTSGSRAHTVSGLTIAGEVYRFKVRAENSIGKSADSAAYSVVGATVPDPPTSFSRNDALTTTTQVAFSWSAPVDDGGSTILDYSVLIDDNNDGEYSVAAAASTSASHEQAGLSPGNTYRFRVTARNIVGASEQSAVFTILAATVPGQPAPPTTALSGDSTLVVIDWAAPSELGGLSVAGYLVEI